MVEEVKDTKEYPKMIYIGGKGTIAHNKTDEEKLAAKADPTPASKPLAEKLIEETEEAVPRTKEKLSLDDKPEVRKSFFKKV